jgi:transposase
LVKPHGKANQNDRADAEAIREAVTRPTTRFVAIQNVERPTMLSVPRVRRLRVAERPAPAHPIRGLLSEFGIVIPQAIHSIGKPIQAILEAAENEPTRVMRERILGGYDRLKRLTEALDEHEKPIRLWHKGNEWRAKREAIPGIGPRTARALVASLGHALDFKNGGRLAAFIGLVPRQPSSGGQQNLPGIGKRGDVYRRAPLIHGARAVIRFADTKTDKDPWLEGLMRRRNKNMASVALANKQVRTMGALPTQGGAFDRHYVSTPPAARAAGKIRFQGCKPASTVRRRPRRNGTGDPSIWRKRSDRE